MDQMMLPPAFLASKKQREELTERVYAAQSRLRSTLGLGEASTNKNQEKTHNVCVDNDLKQSAIQDESGGGKRRRVDSYPSMPVPLNHMAIAASSTDAEESTSALDVEDLAIERQLLAGVSAADIIAGSTEGRHASQHEQAGQHRRHGHGTSRGQDGHANEDITRSSSTQPWSSTALGSADTDLTDEQLQPGGDFLRSEAEIAVIRRWMTG
jgi:hypothetical protein